MAIADDERLQLNSASEGGSGLTIAVIPARGGSKGVPRKNLARVGGRALVARAVDSAIQSGVIDRVYVSTDDDEIAAAAISAGARVIRRPEALAGDESTSESAVLHACDHAVLDEAITIDTVAFIQATSPYIDPDDLAGAIRLVRSKEYDSVFSAVETFEFLWSLNTDKAATAVNHDATRRPRRQDRNPDYRETGAFYIMNYAGFRSAEHRFFGRVGVQSVDDALAVDIDTPRDLFLARTLSPMDKRKPIGLAQVRAVVTDFDGVHTPDTVYVDEHGTESVRASRADGLGLEALRQSGIPIAILSKERNGVVSARGRKLGIQVLQGISDKRTALIAWAEEHQLDLADILFVGNDRNDLGAMGIVGWPVAVADARPEVLSAARLILHHQGGKGALRELADQILTERDEENSG